VGIKKPHVFSLYSVGEINQVKGGK